VGALDAVEFAAGHGELLLAVVAVGGADFVAVDIAFHQEGGANFGSGGLDLGCIKALAAQKLFEFGALLVQTVEHFLIAGAVYAHGGVPAGALGLEVLFGQAFYGDRAGLAEIFKLAAQHEGCGHEADGE